MSGTVYNRKAAVLPGNLSKNAFTYSVHTDQKTVLLLDQLRWRGGKHKSPFIINVRLFFAYHSFFCSTFCLLRITGCFETAVIV